MSNLKYQYFDGSTGLLMQCDAAFVAGSTFITTTNLIAIGNDLQAQAALGLTSFTLTYPTTFNPVALRGNKGNNLILKAFLAGVQDGLAAQNIYNYEVTPTLNVTDTVTTSINLNFTFQTA